jgi:hypothetical protein
MKKRILLFIAIFMATFQVYSQDSAAYLFHLPKPLVTSLGFYVAPEINYGQVCDEFSLQPGVSAMLLLNNHFAIGGTVQGNHSNSFTPASLSPLVINTRSGGFKMEYTFFPSRIFHFGVNTMIGGGFLEADSLVASSYYTPRGYDDHDNYRQVASSNFVLLKPGVFAEANLLRNVKFFTGASYGLAFDGKHTSTRLTKSMIQGFNAYAGIKVGIFQYRLKKEPSKEQPTK